MSGVRTHSLARGPTTKAAGKCPQPRRPAGAGKRGLELASGAQSTGLRLDSPFLWLPVLETSCGLPYCAHLLPWPASDLPAACLIEKTLRHEQALARLARQP